MKKLLCILCLLLALVCVFAACDETETPNAGNNDNTQNSDDNNQTSHTHAYGEWSVSKAATCTAKGEEKRTCACGESETREVAIDPSAHAYGTDNRCTLCHSLLQYTEGLEYILNSDGNSYTVKKGTALNNTTDIVIPWYHNEKPVTSIGKDAFYNCESLASITQSLGA